MYMSVFNFSIDVTAPECMVPSFGFKNKWSVVGATSTPSLVSK